jgi:hypothetical protein
MAGGKGTFYAVATLNKWLGGEDTTPPTNWYVALYNGDPTGAGTECSGGNYARKLIANNTTTWPSVVAASKKNGIEIAFGALTAALGSITHVALFDSVSGGNMGYWAPLVTPQTHQAGNTFTIPVDGATFTEA